MIDGATAAAVGLHVGDTVGVSVDVRSPQPAHVVGLVRARAGGDLTKASALLIDPGWARALVGISGHWDLVEVRAAAGVSPDVLRSRVAGLLPDDGTSAITGRQYAAAEVANLARRSASVTALLLALSMLAVIVGGGVVASTFTILVAQRERELGLLRVLGMSRRQVYASVLGEAALVGAVASVTGALVGAPSAYGLRALVGLAGAQVVGGGIHVQALTLLATAAAGTVLTVAVGTVPARRATRRAPMDVWRVAPGPPGRRGRWSIVWGTAGLGATAMLVVGLNGPPADRAVVVNIAGALLTVVVVASVPLCAPQVLRAVGAVAARTGAPGMLASAHARADATRVAAPAGVLVLGLGIVTCVSVLSASAHASVHSLVRRSDRSDIVVVSDAAPGVDPEAVERIREAPDVAAVSEVGADTFQVDGRTDQLSALDTDAARQTLDLAVSAGSLARFADGDIAITRGAASRHGYRVGDVVAVRFAQPQRRHLRIVAVIADNGITRDWVIPFETYRIGYQSATIRDAFVKGRPDVAPARLRREVGVGLVGFPGVRALDAAGYATERARQAQGPVALVQAMVGLAIVVALLGVANALSLSVTEHIAELGLLTVLGMTPAQVSLTVQWEAVLVGVLGTGFGVVGGLVLGCSLVSASSVRGATQLVVPLATIVAVAIAVVGAAFVAAAVPGRRAVRLGGLAALARQW